jgi:uncharacterized membrane protein YedE/YeeE
MLRVFEFLAGLLFGLGLILSGMTNPAKVLGFLAPGDNTRQQMLHQCFTTFNVG